MDGTKYREKPPTSQWLAMPRFLVDRMHRRAILYTSEVSLFKIYV